MASITFDSVQIHDATHVPQFIKHETIADRVVTSMPQARDDGEIVVSELWGKKTIALQGTLIGTSQTDLESKIDTFNELMSRQEKNLDIDWNGSTRRYVASCTKLTYDRDHYNTSAVPWTAEFTIYSGEGKDTGTTTALNAHSLTITTPATDSFTMNGSKPAKPLITLTGSNWPSPPLGIEYKNTDTAEKIVITRAGGLGASTGVVKIDCLAKTVTGNINSSVFSAYNFYGIFPKFKIGTNNIRVAAGNLVNQCSTDYANNDTASSSGSVNIWGTIKDAQSFMVPYTDATFQSIVILIFKIGSPTSTISCRIETDNNNAPSGSLADTNLTQTFSASGESTSRHFKQVSFSNPGTLQANTKYWLIVQSNNVGDDSSNNINWCYDSVGDYANGMARQNLSGSWVDGSSADFVFSINYGGLDGSLGSCTHTVTYTGTYL